MILIEREAALPSLVATAKRKVIAALATMHMVHTFDTVKELEGFLDQGLAGLAQGGLPPKLSRVLLFCRNQRAVDVVKVRMYPGAALHVWTSPGCWLQLWEQEGPTLRAQARRFEPTFEFDTATFTEQ